VATIYAANRSTVGFLDIHLRSVAMREITMLTGTEGKFGQRQ